jgi:hypothetical protein
MRTLLTMLLILLFQGICLSQDIPAPTYEQEREWRQQAEEAGRGTMFTSTVRNFYRNKLIFLVIGGIVVAIGGFYTLSDKKEE